jgi:hypothetical protein
LAEIFAQRYSEVKRRVSWGEEKANEPVKPVGLPGLQPGGV